MLGFFNKWNIITFLYKATTSKAFEYIHQVTLDGISYNIASLVRSGKYGSMNTTDSTKMGYYMNKFDSEAFALQKDTTCDGKISKAGKLVVKAQYMSCMQEKTKWYWEKYISNNS